MKAEERARKLVNEIHQFIMQDLEVEADFVATRAIRQADAAARAEERDRAEEVIRSSSLGNVIVIQLIEAIRARAEEKGND